MCRKLLPFLSFLFLLPATHARSQDLPGIQRIAASHYDVVALRVEFQPDSSAFTSGNGLFDGPLFEDADEPRVDPLPHDSAYFSAHLDFLENYVRRVSDGRTIVKTHLLPAVVRVSQPMGAYAPTGPDANSDAELAKLAGLVREAWSLAGRIASVELPTGLDPGKTAFVLFHAGVGRDVELVGTTLDKTPEDLPSIFFSAQKLGRLLAEPVPILDGVPVSNTLVIPRTETRKGFDFISETSFLAELSINGMLAASFLSYLGVPDLFDAETGESAIGPFGVMDGLGIFAYAGLLPPEPSAWTKYYLGWADVKVPAPLDGDQPVSLRHAGGAGNDVFVASVGASEYFLVENRHRDPEGDGLNLRVWRGGDTIDVHFDNADPGFNSSSVSAYPGGVLVDADNLDFSLPGGVDEAETALLGGALIWHVDERRLQDGLPENRVNVGADQRSIDLEEADGAQDIGFPNQGLFGASFDAGSPFDFFYEGNPTTVITATGSEVRLYENRFGEDTFPNSRTNAGGASFFEFDAFSTPGPEMSFVYRRTEWAGIRRRSEASVVFDPVATTMDRPIRLYTLDEAGADFAVFGSDERGAGVLAWSKGGEVDGVLTPLAEAEPAQTGLGLIALGRDAFWELSPAGELRVTAALPSSFELVRATTPVVATIDDRYLVGAVDASGPALLSAQYGLVTVERLPEPLRGIAVVDGLRPVFVYADHVDVPLLDLAWFFETIEDPGPIAASFVRATTAFFEEKEVTGALMDAGRARIVRLGAGGAVDYIDLRTVGGAGISGSAPAHATVLDLTGDGRPGILATVGQSLVAFNEAGATVEGFPVPLRANTSLPPLIANFEGLEKPVVFVAAEDGRIDAYDLSSEGRPVPGFPLTAGLEPGAFVLTDASIAAVSNAGSVSVWDVDALENLVLGQPAGDGNRSFTALSTRLPQSCYRDEGDACDGSPGIFVDGESYNWPNPIEDGVTWIRFRPVETSDVLVTIVDMAGRRIDELEKKGAPGGVSSEIRWSTSAGSGVYFARIRAKGSSGRTGNHLIKMAIVR